MFQRNILSSFSGLKLGCWEVNSLYRVRGRTRLGGKLANQSQGMKRRWSGPIWNPQAGNREEGWVERERERKLAL
jgi:hypothetical protein